MTKTKKKIKKKFFNYTVIFESAKEGGFVVHVPSFLDVILKVRH